LNNIKIFLVYKIYSPLKRKLFNQSKLKSGKKKSSNIDLSQIVHLINKVSIIVPKRILFFFTFFLLLFVFLSINIKLNSLEIEDYFLSSKKDEEDFSKYNQLNYIVYNLAAKDEENSHYKYINYVVLVSLDRDSISLYQINPFIVVKDNVPIYSYLINNLADNVFSDLNYEISELMGIRIDRYIAVDTEEFTNLNELLSYENKSEFLRYLSDIKTPSDNYSEEEVTDYSESFFSQNISIYERFRIILNMDKINNTFKSNATKSEFNRLLKIFLIDKRINITTIGSKQSTIAENKTLVPNKVLIDEEIKEITGSLGIAAEQSEIEVYNATDESGLALKKVRELQNIGINVVKFGNYSEDSDENILYVNSEGDLERFKNTIIAIQENLKMNLKVEIGKYKGNRTGDLILILGA